MTAPAISSSEILERIGDLDAELINLDEESKKLTFRSVSGDTDATARLDAIDARRTAIRTELQRLNDAKSGAFLLDTERRDAEKIAKRNAGRQQARNAARAILAHAARIDAMSAELAAIEEDLRRLETEAGVGLVSAGLERDGRIGMVGIAALVSDFIGKRNSVGQFTAIPFSQTMAMAWNPVLALKDEGNADGR